MNYFGFPLSNKFRSKTPRGFYDAVKGHTGIDIICPIGTGLSLPVHTKVFDFLKQPEMGNCLYLKDFNGNVLVFAHLSEVLVKVGQSIAPNETFAKTGNTGSKTTAPHLHLEIISPKPDEGLEFMTRSLGKAKGYNIDPEQYLNSLTLGSGEDLEWLKEHQIIFGEHRPSDPVTWGELATVVHRLAKKVIEWTSNNSKP